MGIVRGNWAAGLIAARLPDLLRCQRRFPLQTNLWCLFTTEESGELLPRHFPLTMPVSGLLQRSQLNSKENGVGRSNGRSQQGEVQRSG